MNDNHRPITSKARGICKYYTTQRGCFAGDNCKFLHTADPSVDPSGSTPPALTPYDKAKRCKYFAEGYCKRGDKCWFLHAVIKDPVTEEQAEPDDEELCSICFEKPPTFGLLGGCSHIFCIDCIRKWRDPAGKGGDVGNTKKCPMCRSKCRYIIPSSRFWRDGQEEKAQVVQQYKESMSKVACKHFTASKKKSPKKPMCPFGKDCFYKHLNDDGTPHVLKHGVERSMQEWRNRLQRINGFGAFSFVTGDDVDNFMPNGGSEADVDAFNLAGSIAMDMFDRMVAEVMESSARDTAGRGRGGGGSGRARPPRGDYVREETLQRARMEMVTGAMSAIRDELHRRETPRNRRGGELRPVVVPGTLAPSNWDLDGDGEIDNGWGWNDLITDAAHNGNVEVMERLEILADHMLGSLRIVRGRDTESSPSPPPLEPIGRRDTPPPPLIPIQQDDDDDGMPPLESVSNSSESEDQDSDDDQDSDYDPTDRVQRAERAFDFAFNLAQHLEEPQPPLRPQNDVSGTTAGRSRFSTVVGREEAVEQDYEADDSEDEGEENTSPDSLEAPTSPAAAEPPFVTDGRGRVVWSNKDAVETAQEPAAEPTEETQPSAAGSRSLLGRMFDAFMH